VPAVGDKDVGGLDVAMDDAFGMSGIESISNFDSDIEKKLKLEGPAENVLFEGFAFEKFHGEECLTIFFADIKYCANAWMIESRGSLSLAAEAGEGLRVTGDVGRKEFEGDKAVETSVLGLVNHTHAAPAEFLEDSEMRDGLALSGTGIRHGPAILGARIRQVNGSTGSTPEAH
jgi:hypothetical protein